MTGPRWTQVEDLFVRALEEPDASRADFVRRETGNDGELAHEVLSLLDHARGGGLAFQDLIGAEIARLAETWTARSGTRIGAYRLDERLGEGGMGVVYAASRDDAQFKQSVAIKILRHGLGSPGAIARFRDERQILATLEHPNIVRLLDGGSTDDDLPYIVMERVRGVSITAYARELPIEARVRLFADVCAAVHYAHERGVVHRDLKPSNILVDEAGTPKLLDFSIARPITGEIEREAHTRPGALMFTPEYASPEQARGEPTGIASDIYSLGAVLHELLAGAAKLPPDLHAIVAQAMHEEPARRYTSAAALADDLQRYLAGSPVAAHAPSLWYRARKAMRRRRAPILAACAAVVASVVGFGAYLATSRSDDCAPARERLAGVWDAATRDALGKRFGAAGRADVDATWRELTRHIDKTAVTWAAHWDEACHAPDRASDPLLYAQRLTCLENVLIELHGGVASFFELDTDTLVYYDDLGSVGRIVEDCASTAVLRAQVPAPPPELRDRVSALLVDAYRAEANASEGSSHRDAHGFEAATAQLDAAARELERIHPPAAALPVLLRAELVAGRSWDVASRLPAARAAIDDARVRIAATRDDVMLAKLELLAAQFELFFERDGDRIALGEAALARAEQALARAGDPREPSLQRLGVRAMLAHVRGDDAGAVAAMREAYARDDIDHGPGQGWWSGYGMMSAIAGDARTAIDESRRHLALATASLGEDHPITGMLYMGLSRVLYVEGDLAGALAACRRWMAVQEKIANRPGHWPAWATSREAELARRAGESNDRELLAAVHELAGKGTTPPHQSPDGIATARRAGLWAVFERATELEADSGGDEALDAAAWLAFARGDDAELARRTAMMVARCARAPCDDWIRTARWLAVLVDARAGRTADVEPRLDALERAYAGDRQAIANSGMVLASLGRWDAARARLARARAIPNVWERHSDLVEVDAWLGLALVRAGDLAAARASLEEAVDSIAWFRQDSDGFSYMTPVAQLALAKLLPESDRARARRLAEHARDGFARLGPHRAADREAAERWLGELR
jgi:tetratricopeptide (TPR) repeat protein